jgi:hypothetical protein
MDPLVQTTLDGNGVNRMRRLFVGFVIGAVALLGSASQAAELSSATFRFGIGALPAAEFPGTGATGEATSNVAATLGAGSAFVGNFTTTLTTMAAPPITKITIMVTKNDAGNFSGAAPDQVGGTAKVGGLGSKLLDVPLNVGMPFTFTKSASGVAITAISAPWTAGVAEVTGTTMGTATAMGNNALTPNGSGTLTLVSPVKILTNINDPTAAFGTLELVYGVPEPALPLMALAGAATLAIAGARRRRS